MPYYFECYYCNGRTPYSPDNPEEMELNCEGCGEDICTDCCPNGLCDACTDADAMVDEGGPV